MWTTTAFFKISLSNVTLYVFHIQFRVSFDIEKQTKWLKSIARFVGKMQVHFLNSLFQTTTGYSTVYWKTDLNDVHNAKRRPSNCSVRMSVSAWLARGLPDLSPAHFTQGAKIRSCSDKLARLGLLMSDSVHTRVASHLLYEPNKLEWK